MENLNQQPAAEPVKKTLPEAALFALRQGTIGWIQPGLTDWTDFISGPANPPFCQGQSFKNEWPRLFRLLATVGVLSGTIVATKEIISPTFGKAALAVLVLESGPAMQLLIIGGVLAVVYHFVLAKALRIPVTFSQALFTIMLLGIPWLPLTALIHTFASTNIGWGTLAEVFWFYLSPIVLVGNFSRGISSLHPACNKWRIRASFILPILILIVGFSFLGTGARSGSATVQKGPDSQTTTTDSTSSTK
jgi:hypothetical protein